MIIMDKVIERARENNIKFNPDKFQYRKREAKFMGNILSQGKIKADAVLKTKKRENKAYVLRFLGILKYLAKCTPNLQSGIASIMMLGIVTSEPALAIYNPNLQVIVQTDASKDGLGCVIVQNGHSVTYASRTLSKSEQKWAQNEKEVLAQNVLIDQR